MHRTQPEGVRSGPGDTDRTVHSLRRFVRLAASGNPSVLMAMWAPVLHATGDGLALRSLGESFAGRHVIPRYRGYMKAQAERLLGVRGGGQYPELIEAFGFVGACGPGAGCRAIGMGFRCRGSHGPP